MSSNRLGILVLAQLHPLKANPLLLGQQVELAPDSIQCRGPPHGVRLFVTSIVVVKYRFP